jgi:hypothetical protein
MRTTLCLLLCLTFGCHNSSTGGGIDGGDDGGDDSGVGDGGSLCGYTGTSCMVGTDCCSGICDSKTMQCAASTCVNSGACVNATDCCNLNCNGGQCGSQACTSDGQACGTGMPVCCSGPNACSGGTCKQIGNGCHTAGNACTVNTDCCSGTCDMATKLCANPSAISFCTQVGDICFKDSDCCTAICNLTNGAGTCGAIPGGVCSVDGTKCTGCTTTPPCCSSYCGSYGSAGSTVCQPAGGCRVLGDLCNKNSDCCGGDPTACNLQGSGEVVCNIFDTARKLGICGTPNGSNCPTTAVCTTGPGCGPGTCIPEGDVCHCMLYDSKGICWDNCPAGQTCKTLPSGCSVNSVNANCCGTPGANKMTCRLDKVGVPRCYTVSACANPGQACSSSADCCNGVPCVPNPSGTYVCGTACVPTGGKCSSTADCCAGQGNVCVIPPGQTVGTCGNPNPPGTDGGMTTCSYAGQNCNASSQPCCANNGTCEGPTGAVCAANETDCTCVNIIL